MRNNDGIGSRIWDCVFGSHYLLKYSLSRESCHEAHAVYSTGGVLSAELRQSSDTLSPAGYLSFT